MIDPYLLAVIASLSGITVGLLLKSLLPKAVPKKNAATPQKRMGFAQSLFDLGEREGAADDDGTTEWEDTVWEDA